MVEHQPSKLDTWVRFPSPASARVAQGWSTTLPRLGSRVRIPSRAFIKKFFGNFFFFARYARQMSARSRAAVICRASVFIRTEAWNNIDPRCPAAGLPGFSPHFPVFSRSPPPRKARLPKKFRSGFPPDGPVLWPL